MNSSYCKFLSLLLLQEVFFNESSETLFADTGWFRAVFCVTETDWRSLRKNAGLAAAGYSAVVTAAFLRSCFLLYILRTKNGEAQGRYTKLKGAQNAMSTKNSIPVPEK